MRALLISALLALSVSALPAADLTGTWIGIIPAEDRRPARDIAFHLIQKGQALEGKLYGDGPGSRLVEGRLSDEGGVRFEVETREQAGNQINDVRYRFEGKIDNGAIELTRERIAARDAVSGVEIPVRRPFDSDEEDRERRFDSFGLERLF